MGASASTPGGLGAPQADLDGADGPFQHVPGLRNEGNTCFANAVLQAVAALPQFHAHLERIVRSGSQPGMAKAMDPLCQLVAGAGAGSLQDARDAMFEAGGSASQQTRAEADDVDQRTQLAGRLLGLVQRLSRASVAPVAPEDSRVVVGDFNAMFRRHGDRAQGRSQWAPSMRRLDLAMLFAAADAASITSVMHHARQSLAADPSGRALQELVQSAIRTARLSSGLPVTPLLVSPAQLVSLARPRRTKLRSPFRGATATCIKCLGCNTFSDWSLQPFTCLSLPIHGSDVRTCLSRQLHDERISEDYRCDRCHGVHPAVKRSRLVRLPSVLVIHLQRQTVGAYGPVKISAAVRFGVSLDVSALCARARSPRDAAAAEGTSADEAAAIAAAAAGAATSKRPSGKAVYSLMSVVTHLGGPFGGHYVAFRRVPQPASTRAGPESEAVRKPAKGLWAYVSDEVTKSVPLAEVKKAEAYMLMYARSDPDADPACGAEGVSREPGLGYWDVSGGGHRLAYSYA